MSKLYVLVGIPASGKSTICGELKKEGVIIYSTDNIRGELFGNEGLQYTEEWLKSVGYSGGEDQFEKYQFANILIFNILYERINEKLKEGYDVAGDATNVTLYARKMIIDNCSMYADEVHCIVMATPLNICLERNSKRERTLDIKAIMRIANSYKEPTLEEGFTSIRFVNDKNLIDYGNKTGEDSSLG